ncbi:glycosyltransferase [uncultured Methanomethylovorans sp.]|uniref:glycosyltransferase n=1 Tax=uncultured Methanomethylovorans sp. TaxID=183759 RepID=UPI00260B26FF|nr:glycosyltransferase [uncultured Methanomethylovorans sp.]
MNILVIPTTDWTRHPVPNRLNFIFDIMAEKHNVHVINFKLKKFKDQKPRTTKCKLHDVTAINVNDPSAYYIVNSAYHMFKIRNILKKEKIDVVVSANILPAFLVNLVKGKTPIVFDYLDHYEESAATYYPDSFFGRIVKYGVRQIIHYNLKNADVLITVTTELRDFLQHLSEKSIHVIPNGVDTSVFEIIPREYAKKELGLDGTIIGYVGSLEYWIDLETAIKTLPKLDAKLLIIGPGLFTDYGETIKSLASELGVLDRMIFKGRVEYSELYRYISAMDIGLNPLKHVMKNEVAVGGKIFNYLACGVPVLSSRMRAVENVLGNDLYYYDDEVSFIESVQNILAAEIDRQKYIDIAEAFDWRNIATMYEKVIRSLE